SGERRLPACSWQRPRRLNIFAAAIVTNAGSWSRQAAETYRPAACAPQKQNSRHNAHVDPVKPANTGERAAIFFPFLDVAFAIRGTDEQRVITGRGGGPLCFPE